MDRKLGVWSWLVLGLVAVACASKSPEEKVVELRSRFTVDLNQSGFIAKPRLNDPTGGPVRHDILLDLVVSTTAREVLPRLTVDLVQLDAAKTEKHRYQVQIDTSKVAPGASAQITQELADVAYTEGDVFYSEVRNPVPADDRARYPEFSASP